MNDNNNIYEGKRYQNHELDQLIEDFKKYSEDNPDAPPIFKGKVDSNPLGEGGEQEIWFVVDEDEDLNSYTFPHQHDIDGVDYTWDCEWTDGRYKGSITITRLPK